MFACSENEFKSQLQYLLFKDLINILVHFHDLYRKDHPFLVPSFKLAQTSIIALGSHHSQTLEVYLYFYFLWKPL